MVSTNTETIYFHFLIERFFFPQRNRLKDFLKRLLKEEGKKEATVSFAVQCRGNTEVERVDPNPFLIVGLHVSDLGSSRATSETSRST